MDSEPTYIPAAKQTDTLRQKSSIAADLMPLPRCTSRSNIKTRSKKSDDGSVVLTSSPYLEKAQKLAANTELKSDKVVSAKRRLVTNKPAARIPTNSSSCNKKRHRLVQPASTTSNAEKGKDDVNCLNCNELYSMSRSREVWVMCEECNS